MTVALAAVEILDAVGARRLDEAGDKRDESDDAQRIAVTSFGIIHGVFEIALVALAMTSFGVL